MQQQNDFPTVCSQLSYPAEFISLEEDLSCQAVSSECLLRIPTGYAPYFYGASKKSLHKPGNTSENRLFHISYGFNYYLQLLGLQFLSKTHLNLKKKSLLASK